MWRDDADLEKNLTQVQPGACWREGDSSDPVGRQPCIPLWEM